MSRSLNIVRKYDVSIRVSGCPQMPEILIFLENNMAGLFGNCTRYKYHVRSQVRGARQLRRRKYDLIRLGEIAHRTSKKIVYIRINNELITINS